MRGVLLALVLLPLVPFTAWSQVEDPLTDEAPGCSGNCRGLGIEKVKAGDEHCGLVPRARKDRALDMACSLSEENQESLQSHAEERAWSKCSSTGEGDYRRCSKSLHRWQNVYTHVLSQRCWAECGWAYVIEPARVPAESRVDREESSHE